jgi:hypothetical protein
MANLFAIHSLASSLMTYLRNSYPASLRTTHPCTFTVLSSGELAKMDDPAPRVGLYIYRVSVNEHLRNRPAASAPADAPAPLAVDLHFLLTVWADNAVAEHVICGWVMKELNRRPVMDASSLSADGGWRPDETVQIIPAELTIEDLMRIWDAFAPPYRLSLSYLARVVRIEPDPDEGSSLPVVATRFDYGPGETDP